MTGTETPRAMGGLRADPFTFDPRLRELQRERPVWRVLTPAGDQAWLVVGAPETRALMLTKDLRRTHPDPARAPQYVRNAALELLRSQSDGADGTAWHDWMRQVLVPHFTRRRMEAWRAVIVRRVHEALDRVVAAGPPADLQGVLSTVAMTVLYDLIGVPDAERTECTRLVGEMSLLGELEEPGTAGSRETLLGYLRDLAARRRAAPVDDLMSGIVAHTDDDGAAAELACLVIFAGGDSVVVHLGYAVARLADDPGLGDWLRADPARVTLAVEEVLRTANHGGTAQPHYASGDIEVGGVHIAPGELVLIDFSLANFDERTFARPEDVDFSRTPNPHLTFGYGSWRCLGAPLAQMQMQEVVRALLDRLPGLRLTMPIEELGSLSDVARLAAPSSHGLPVSW